jgi:hypothetical protein
VQKPSVIPLMCDDSFPSPKFQTQLRACLACCRGMNVRSQQKH